MKLDIQMNTIGSSRLLDVPEVKARHEEQKKEILHRIQTFQLKNPTVPFVVFGSSNLILQDQIVLPALSDVDLYCYGSKDTLVEPVPGVDLLATPFMHPDYVSRLVYIDGYACCSKLDTMIAAVSGLRKSKLRDLKYLYILLAYADIDSQQFFRWLDETIRYCNTVEGYTRAVETFKVVYYEKSKEEVKAYEDRILAKEAKHVRNKR